MHRIPHAIRALSLAAALVLSPGALASCGGDDTQANGIDRAFAEQMIPHHQGAVDMARIALERAERPQLRALAEDVIGDQQREIAQLRAALEGEMADVEPASLGMSMEMMGMDMDPAMLRSAERFDVAFIDMMVPHHAGAIDMSEVELARGENPEMQALARSIIASQKREIAQMREWRAAWTQEG